MKTERVKFRFRNLFNFRGFRFFESFIENKCIVCELRRTYKNIGICPDCGKRCRNILDIRRGTVRDLDVGGIKCFVDFISFKISCDCGYSGMELLDFCNKHSRHTKRFEERVAIFCRAMTVKDVAEEFQLSWQTVKDIDKNEMRKYIAPLSEAHPERIGIDEIAYEKGHKYLTVVRDIDLGKVIWVGEGRKKEDLNRFFEELGKERSSRIKAAVMDMWDPYIASVKQHTKSDIVFGKFHIAKKVNEALDKVRKKEFATSGKEERKAMKKKRFLILTRKERLEKDKKEELDNLMKKNTNLYSAYLLKEQALDILDEKSEEKGMGRFKIWFENVIKSGFEEFKSVVNTLMRYWYGVVNFFKHQVTNAGSEGFNNKINVIKRKAFGFRDIEYFKLKILQSCGRFLPKNQ